MKASEIRKLSAKELDAKLLELKDELFKLRFQQAVNQLDNPMRISAVKKDNTSGASHVGIYVGNGMMIHCGDPISYANINTSYWQQHFYTFGRLP